MTCTCVEYAPEMKTLLSNVGKKFWLTVFLAIIGTVFVYVAVRTGPLAPVSVTTTTVPRLPLSPTVSGIGLIEARRSHKIGAIYPGRLKTVSVQPGDAVGAGQILGELDAVDLQDRLAAQTAAIARAKAQLREAEAKAVFASAQAARYGELGQSRLVSAESAEAKRQEQRAADAGRDAARQELARLQAERGGQQRQLDSLRLISPIDGIVVRRDADPGTTVVAGQTVLEVVDPAEIWINARIDQKNGHRLRTGLPARISLRSRASTALSGTVARIEPYADAVTEELLVKIAFAPLPARWPAIGEIAETAVSLPPLPVAPVLPNAAIHRVDGVLGVWLLEDGDLRFTPVETGASDLNGRLQVTRGLRGGETVVLYSDSPLTAASRVKVAAKAEP